MLFDRLVAIVAQKLKNLDNFKDNVIRNIFEKKLDFWKIVKFFFELWLQPSSQKVSKLLKQFIGKNYMGVRAVTRTLHAKIEDSRKLDFHTLL